VRTKRTDGKRLLEEPAMFEPVFESLRKATETGLQMQQEMFKKWAGLWPGVPPSQPAWNEQFEKYQKKWTELLNETLRKRRETLEAQFKSGMKNIEETFRVAEARDFEELRSKTLELWQKTFDSLRQTYEAQIQDFQLLSSKWSEMFTKGPA
jgi:hypothetical protein